MTRKQTCASCARFPKAALESDGNGECEGYERPARFDDESCVLYNRAKDIAVRRPLVARLMELKPE